MASKSLLAALCVVALLAVRSESHGLGDFPSGETTPQMQNFFKPEAAALPESLDGSSMPAATMAAKPEATVIPTTTATTADTSAATAGTVAKSSATPRRSVSVAAGVACGVAAVAVVGIAAAVAYVVRGRRGARRGTAVQLGSSP
ncbi:unnamed protein product [Miscanthus lutarioriparius]|uniref:Uncharacterized protein n=1 Tax=Miscanthus lutarioriparius TaxID=422564 RepID=A0A811QFI9_9POAL|nr:unnamed protein product [Miscanthus lutarioriparius]